MSGRLKITFNSPGCGYFDQSLQKETHYPSINKEATGCENALKKTYKAISIGLVFDVLIMNKRRGRHIHLFFKYKYHLPVRQSNYSLNQNSMQPCLFRLQPVKLIMIGMVILGINRNNRKTILTYINLLNIN